MADQPHPIDESTWIISCPACGRWKTLAEAGGLRIGAVSAGKRVLGRCSSCNRVRMMRIERPPQIPHDHLQKMIENTPEGH
ncbi:MAG: hypothetical protein AMXMBFR58_07180 [Phycisphaerae bacterium]